MGGRTPHSAAGTRAAGCGLRAAGCGLRAAGCGLRAAGCGTSSPPAPSAAESVRACVVHEARKRPGSSPAPPASASCTPSTCPAQVRTQHPDQGRPGVSR
ncbi:hypothetical protein GE265_34070 (plasmid) [Streptomyces clavuligerus]|nr:hypothetical protein GE265_34070 [Streptomyces clavuligerus]